MAEAEQVPEVHNGPSQSRIVLAKPRLGGFGRVALSSDSSKTSANPFSKVCSGSLLRPPQLKPTLAANPSLRAPETESTTPKEEPNKDERLKETTDDTEAPKFVPLGGNTKTSNPVPAPNQSASSSSSSGFVFGQNLSERVFVGAGINNGGFADHCSINGNSELLFTAAAASNKSEETTSSSVAENNVSESLAAAAAEYERSHARPSLPAAPAPTTTGEEGETNVMQVTCRLFAWEAGSWRERGRGVLRLNDGAGSSRLVCRVLGSLRVVLNTQVWAEMVADRAGAKSLRITAADAHNQVKVFLVMATPSDILHLHRELTTRISRASSLKSINERTSSQISQSEEAIVDYDDPGCDDVIAEAVTADIDEMSHDGVESIDKDEEQVDAIMQTSNLEHKNEHTSNQSDQSIEPIIGYTAPSRDNVIPVMSVTDVDETSHECVGTIDTEETVVESKVEENIRNGDKIETDDNAENEAKIKQLKRKDENDDEIGVSTKRQCPEIVIE